MKFTNECRFLRDKLATLLLEIPSSKVRKKVNSGLNRRNPQLFYLAFLLRIPSHGGFLVVESLRMANLGLNRRNLMNP
jgi:hypothetical protein